MKKTFFLCFILFSTFCFSQDQLLNLVKTSATEFNLDGALSESELKNASELDIIYEHLPGYNTDPSYKTVGYVNYSDEFIYIAFKAYRDEVVASIHSRDNSSLFSDDFVNIHLDTYGDARNNIGLTANLYGSQADGIRVESSGFGSRDSGWSLDANFDYESLGRLTDFGYEVEFIIPFSSLPFPNGKNQRWKLNLSTSYRDQLKQGSTARAYSSKLDRENSCKLCQLDHTIVMKDISYKKNLDFLPYVSSNLSGQREKYYDRVNYSSPEVNYGIGVNLEINKNLSIEATLNPDFSQVEADVTKIDINSPTAINYPERRPFFNRGIDVLDYTMNVFYSRSVNNPSFASKVLNQGKKSRIYMLTAIDQDSPYIVPTQFESFSGVGGRSFNNVLRYQNILNPNIQIGALATNRLYDGDAYGNLLGIDGLFKFTGGWKFELEYFRNSNKEPEADWIDSDKSFSNYTVKLDGESFSGDALYTELRRDTDTWRSFVRYTGISPTFRADNGFIVENNLKKYEIWHGYYKYPDTKLLRNYRISARYDREYSYSNILKRSAFEAYISFLTILNTDFFYNYEFNFYDSHLVSEFKNFKSHYVMISSKPLDFINIRGGFGSGNEIAYREEIPQLGERFTFNTSIEITINDNLRIKPSINFSRLKKLDSEEYFFDGYIARFDVRYQFTNSLDFRVISEYNEFSDQFFAQPLISWRPNPDTIFYFGGNQNFIDEFADYNSPNYRVNKSQLFMKFQYLIKS
ncbi:MAG: hypothetical protein HOC22_00745 [Cryomorphaceae bacterium]|jgi:hypothetical protein|nr:hypothetical protein [Cryomorphaceae bacterium]MBT3503498.1 hypothetical protein [Cryomorphaceae bacterium]MBT3688602.1 hypothetical protein [Cryomorphaceae bacterium]MBT4221896.1 hypothetical protein [Cryomorphaceae bacterium]MBT4294160.1 hypothetical protein [Cryomorphaceae bacterium]